jgi:hypothetical protein
MRTTGRQQQRRSPYESSGIVIINLVVKLVAAVSAT